MTLLDFYVDTCLSYGTRDCFLGVRYLLVRFPDLLWEVGRENEPPERGVFFFQGLYCQKCCFYPPIQHTYLDSSARDLAQGIAETFEIQF